MHIAGAYKFIGAAAAFFTMFGFLPQLIKTLKTKSAKDVSLMTLFQFAVGVSLWAIYGICLRDIIIIIANIVTLSILIILLCAYLYYGGKRRVG